VPISPRFVSFAWRYLGVTRSLRSWRTSGRQGLEFVTRVSGRTLPRKQQESPSSWEPQSSVCHVPNRRRQDCLHQTIRCSSVALVIERQRLPRLGLSTRSISMAFGLAVYASPSSLPNPTPKLASSCCQLYWTDSHPQGSAERFQSCGLHLIPPFPSLPWRNRCNRCREATYAVCRRCV